jgi:Protein of unknown function (DUF4079)
VDLPSFLWLWRIAAWAMGFAIVAYLLQAGTGFGLIALRRQQQPRPGWLRPLHWVTGGSLVLLVLLLLAIGIVGTLGHYGSLGHSAHLPTGLAVVDLVFLSAWSAVQISPQRPWAKPLHLVTNALLCVALAIVSWTGWSVVQKYL